MKFDFQTPDMTAVREAVARAKDQAMRARDEAERAVRGLRIVTTDDGLTKSTRIDLGRATITFSDDQGELKIENANGRKMLTAKDAEGKELYNGPIETPEDRAKLPDNVRQRLEKLERQELPEAPEPPEAPEAPQPPETNESVRLQSVQGARARALPGRAGRLAPEHVCPVKVSLRAVTDAKQRPGFQTRVSDSGEHRRLACPFRRPAEKRT